MRYWDETFAKCPLSPPASAGRCVRPAEAGLKILNIFLWLIPLKRDSRALILNPALAGNVFQRSQDDGLVEVRLPEK